MPLARTAWTLAALAGAGALAYGALYRGAGLWAAAGLILLAAAWRARVYRLRPRPGDAALAAAATLVSLVLAFGALEWAVRRFVHPAAWQGDGLVTPHPGRIWTPAPGRSGTGYVSGDPGVYVPFDFAISSYGLRGPAPAPKEPGEFRILMLGDSFTLGRGVDDGDAIPVQVERILGERFPGRALSVFNGGCGGYGPWQAAGLLEEIGWPLEPDLVVLQLLMDNDLHDTLARQGRLAEAYEPGNAFFKTVYGKYHRDVRARIEDWVYQRCRVYKILVQRTAGLWRLTRLLDGLRGFDGPLVPAFPPNAPRPPYLEASRVHWDPALEDAWREMRADVLAIRGACERRGTPLIVWAAPSAAYTVDADWPFAGDAAYDRGKPERLLREFADAAGVDYRDAYPFMRARAPNGGLYHQLDGHFTAAGARAAAEFLAEVLIPAVPVEP